MSRDRRALPQALDAHVAALASCRRCAGLDPAVRPILSESRAPRAMLVGQAPGRTEVGEQRPFAGRSGRTLFRWLARAGVDKATFRERVYIAAITRCFPGPSPCGRGDRVPSREERARCAPWLEAELALLGPPLIIPVGRLAIDRFLGPAPLERLVGEVHRITLHGHATAVLPLPHPSGASSWVNAPANRVLLERALDRLGTLFAELGVVSDATVLRRSA